MNFLYCFDENYNLQAYNSINSFVINLNEKSNFFIIHKSPSTFEKYLKNLNLYTDHNFYIYKFDRKNYLFPGVDNTHVSEATYYRLFIHEYLPEKLEKLIYVDCDVLCIDYSEYEVEKIFSEIEKNNLVIGVKTEMVNNKDYIDNLMLKQEKYFNAGVMFISYKKWTNLANTNIFKENLFKLKDRILWWDQDVLNHTFDGQYVELEASFNYPIERNIPFDNKFIGKNVYFLHYQGKNKPWKIDSVGTEFSSIYTDYFRKLNIGKFHIVTSNPFLDFVKYIKLLFSDSRIIDSKWELTKSYFKAVVHYLIK